MTRDRAVQAPLVHRPGTGGIWARYLLDGGAVNAAPFLDAQSRQQVVGTCRECGGYLKPAGQPYPVGAVTWYPVACVGKAPDEPCGHEAAASGPRPKPKPSRPRAGP